MSVEVFIKCNVNLDTKNISNIDIIEGPKKLLNKDYIMNSYNSIIEYINNNPQDDKTIEYQNRIYELEEEINDIKNKYDNFHTNIHGLFDKSATSIIEKSSVLHSKQINEQNRCLQKVLSSIKDLNHTYEMSSKNKSTKKVGDEGEQYIIQKIQSMYPDWCVQDTHGKAESGDFHSFIESSVTSKTPWILNEVKTHKSTIRTAEVRKFYRDIDNHKPPMAIMFSLYSNIVGKPHGHYEFRNNTTHIFFISHVMNNPECIQFTHSILLKMYNSSLPTEEVCEPKSQNVEIDDIKEKLKTVEKSSKEKHKKLCAAIEYMLQRDQRSIKKYNKEISLHLNEIKQKKNEIQEIEANIQKYSAYQFEVESFENHTETKDKYPFYCSRCEVGFKNKNRIRAHLNTKKHRDALLF